jgi:hypothetical protein
MQFTQTLAFCVGHQNATVALVAVWQSRVMETSKLVTVRLAVLAASTNSVGFQCI